MGLKHSTTVSDCKAVDDAPGAAILLSPDSKTV